MSLAPPGTAPFTEISLYASVQVAVTCAALYDHFLSLGREVELIWMKPLSLVTALYVIERYLGDVVLIMLFTAYIGRCIQLFEFRAWGALVYAWATQATMQLRIYALYRRSKRILALMLIVFFCEIAAIAFIIWREIGPSSDLQADNDGDFAPQAREHICTFTGIDGKFVYLFIPFLCFELFIFLLAALILVENMRHSRQRGCGKRLWMNSFMSILARDSICYFFINLVASAVVTGLWQGVTELYANMCIPFVMFLEVLVGTRLILDFRERYAHPDSWEPTLSGRFSPLLFRGDDIRMDTPSVSVRCEVETIVITDGEI